MKIAQEIRSGNVIMVGKDAMVVLKAEFTKSGRNASVVKMKLKKPAQRRRPGKPSTARTRSSRSPSSTARKSATRTSPILVRVHGQRRQPVRSREGEHGRGAEYVENGMPAALVIYNDKPIAVEIPQTIVREIAYTEPA